MQCSGSFIDISIHDVDHSNTANAISECVAAYSDPIFGEIAMSAASWPAMLKMFGEDKWLAMANIHKET